MKTFKSLIIISIILILSSCKEEKEIGTVVASVNGIYLTMEQLKASYGDEIWDEMTLEEQREIVQQWVDMTILYSHAENNEHFREDIALQFMANNALKKVFANALIAHELNNLSFSNEELYNFYRLREAEFTEQVREFRVQRIYFTNEENMQRVKRMLDNREIAFTPAAQRFSEEAIGRNGGFMANLVTKAGPDSLLWRELDRMERFFEITAPYGDGWVIARWQEFRTATANRSFYSVRSEIEEIMKEERKFELYEQILLEARIASQIMMQL